VPSCGGVVPRGELAPRLVGGLRRDDGVLVLIERPDRLRPSSGTLRPDDFHRLRLHRLHGAGDDVALRWLFTRRHGWLKVSIEHPPTKVF